MQPDLWSLYRQMFRSRLFEQAVAELWEQGLISGEMHLGVGEEAIAAGVNAHLKERDALALDHRGTPPLLMRGVDPVLLLRELLGRPDGLCGGMGGHMHLFSREHLAASSGIVGSSGPAAVGFALAAQHLRPGTLAAAYFGEASLNQGMLMEAMNMAVAWNLPVIFVCKDNGWGITTQSEETTGGGVLERARGFGLPTLSVDGLDVEEVWQAAGEAEQRARQGGGPTFIHARCIHPEGHFLGDPLLQIARNPVKGFRGRAWPLVRSITKMKGASLLERGESMRDFTSMLLEFTFDHANPDDPLIRARKKLAEEEGRLNSLEEETLTEIETAIETALAPMDAGEEIRP